MAAFKNPIWGDEDSNRNFSTNIM